VNVSHDLTLQIFMGDMLIRITAGPSCSMLVIKISEKVDEIN